MTPHEQQKLYAEKITLTTSPWSGVHIFFSSRIQYFPACNRNSPHFTEKIHYGAHRNPATYPYPEPDKSSPRLPSCVLIHFNIILPSTPRSSTWSLSFRLPHQNGVCAYPLSDTCHMPRQSHCPWFYQNLIIYFKLIIYQG